MSLILAPINAALTRNTELFYTNMDPYCIIKVHDVIKKTKVAHNQGKHPKWDDTFKFKLNSIHTEVKIDVYDKDTFTKDDLIGKG